MDTTTFRSALGALMYERFGITLPAAYQAATGATYLMADLLPADMLSAFLRAALEADEKTRQPDRSLTATYSTYLSRGLDRALGDDRDHPGLDAAWHLGRILPNLLPDREFAAFIHIVQKALEQSSVVPVG